MQVKKKELSSCTNTLLNEIGIFLLPRIFFPRFFAVILEYASACIRYIQTMRHLIHAIKIVTA